MSVRTRYQQALQERAYVADDSQLAAVELLDQCAQAWASYKNARSNTFKKWLHHPAIPKGVYLYGGVGRGKSFLMDLFYDEVPLKRKVRLHFHEFMRDVHAQLNRLKGQSDPLAVLAQEVAKKYKLICFDEFHVANIADAMILQRLLQALFEEGVGLVMTSNFAPDDLYPNGLNRERILPAIELLKTNMQVQCVDQGVDYRRQTLLEQAALYLYPINAKTQAEMENLWEKTKGLSAQSPNLHIEGRVLRALQVAGTSVWFDFRSLCDGPRSQNDYLRVAERFQTVMLSGVPAMGVAMAQAARRFTWLIDVLYDQRTKLIMQAQVPAEKLYTQGPLVHEFARTVSRLHEMQSSEYLALGKRHVDVQLINQ